MATLGNTETPTPGLFAAVLHELRNANPRECGVAETLREFLNALTALEAGQLPLAIGGVLPLLRGDMERLRFAADVLVRFDLFEAAGELADVALRCGDQELTLSAAVLCGNPAVDEPIRVRVADAMSDSRVGQLRIDATSQPITEEEWILYWQCWPGSRRIDRKYPLAPVIVLDRSLDSGALLRLAARLDDEGASVRRLASEAQIPNWFGPQTVAVCHPLTRIAILNRYPDFSESRLIVDDLVDGDQYQDSIVRRINDALPVGCRLRRVTHGDPRRSTSTVNRVVSSNEPAERAALNRPVDSPRPGAKKILTFGHPWEAGASDLDRAGAQEGYKEDISSEYQDDKLSLADDYADVA